MSRFYAFSIRALSFALVTALFCFFAQKSYAQPAITPSPRPAPAFDPNADMEDSEIEEMDEDTPGRPPMPPPPPPSASQPSSGPSTPQNDVRTSQSGKANEPKVKFKIADDVYFEKGKRRGRSSDNRKSYTKPTSPSPSDF